MSLAGEALLERTRPLLEEVEEAVAVTQSLGGQLSFLLAEMWAPVFTSPSSGITLEERRQAIEQLYAQFPPLPETLVEPVNAGGVPSFRIAAEPEFDTSVFYLHGGLHLFGSAYGHRGLIGAFSAASHAGALAPEFRLAPSIRSPPISTTLSAHISGCSRRKSRPSDWSSLGTRPAGAWRCRLRCGSNVITCHCPAG
jgi:epsilon-lactone hydrolase